MGNPQDQVYPQQQAARSSQVPQHGYGQKNNYQGPQGTFPGQQMNIPPGFPHQPPQPAPSQENELKAMLKQLLQGQADGVVDTSKKLAEINSKIENVNTRVYSLENHASSVAAATKQGHLPGKAIQDPKEQCKVFWSILEHIGHEEHGGTWRMEAAQLDTQRKKGEAILKTSSTVHSTGQASTRSS
ncbi:unnamed protein product [Microthlaspi erraticum]|uniref:Uncharacterized protein n=1 Tax=Microthlaspi erraticum TaxID=1685480 RepID=A0A6D2KX40_9BRAS|nr:unnamed protein product [Microthlaspi erraticum]